MTWYLSLPPAEARVPCGTGTHVVRWEAGRLALLAHPDREAEVVLAALGGARPRCVAIAETWARHAADLDVLMLGPRSPADEVTVGWEDAEVHRASWFGLFDIERLPPGLAGRASRGVAGSGPRHQSWLAPGRGATADLTRRVQSRIELTELLALGAAFQFRLAGTVAAAWAAGGAAGGSVPGGAAGGGPPGATAPGGGAPGGGAPDGGAPGGGTPGATAPGGGAVGGRAPGGGAPGGGTPGGGAPGGGAADGGIPGTRGRRPELTAALAGRFALVAHEWLGIDPGAVRVMLSDTGPAELEAHVDGNKERRLRAALPVGWLAEVWACGLALVGGHLVIAVEQPGWPRARVLALSSPGAAPTPLDVMAAGDGSASWSPGGLPRWEIAGAGGR
jgi:hypothetical protein